MVVHDTSRKGGFKFSQQSLQLLKLCQHIKFRLDESGLWKIKNLYIKKKKNELHTKSHKEDYLVHLNRYSEIFVQLSFLSISLFFQLPGNIPEL